VRDDELREERADCANVLREAGLAVDTAVNPVDQEEGRAAALAGRAARPTALFRGGEPRDRAKTPAKPHG
jgi:hypothetical protein